MNCEWCGSRIFETDRNCPSCGGTIKIEIKKHSELDEINEFLQNREMLEIHKMKFRIQCGLKPQ